MTQLQGFGALLFGAVALAFIGAVAVIFGGPIEITLALAAMFAAYACQWLLFNHEVEPNSVYGTALAFYFMVGSILLGGASFLMSVWF